jgi:hypothetical protein
MGDWISPIFSSVCITLERVNLGKNLRLGAAILMPLPFLAQADIADHVVSRIDGDSNLNIPMSKGLRAVVHFPTTVVGN